MPNLLEIIDDWASKGMDEDSIIEGLPLRSDDETYSAYMWCLRLAEKGGTGDWFPEKAHQPDPTADGVILAHCMQFPSEVILPHREVIYMAGEWLCREARRKAKEAGQ